MREMAPDGLMPFINISFNQRINYGVLPAERENNYPDQKN